MNKIVEKYLESIQDESGVSSSAGIGFAVDNPYGFVQKKPYPKGTSTPDVCPKDKKRKRRREVIMDEDITYVIESSVPEKRVLVDFDGVIHNYNNGWQNGEVYGGPIEEVKDALERIKKTYDNVKIIIFTTRAAKNDPMNVNELKGYDYDDQISKVKEFLDKHEIPYDGITGEKLAALIYIDDNGFRFNGNWGKSLPTLLKIIKERMGTK